MPFCDGNWARLSAACESVNHSRMIDDVIKFMKFILHLVLLRASFNQLERAAAGVDLGCQPTCLEMKRHAKQLETEPNSGEGAEGLGAALGGFGQAPPGHGRSPDGPGRALARRRQSFDGPGNGPGGVPKGSREGPG